MIPQRPWHAPTLAEFEAIALEARARLPAPFRDLVKDVPIHVEEFCDEETEREMGLKSPFELSGLYRGTPEPEKASGHVAHDHDRIFLYRRPLLDEWCETGIDLRELIRHVLIHEIGHHFGFSDADMEAIEES
jgi:predicted Zn-dependent protease with MMP-like domain